MNQQVADGIEYVKMVGRCDIEGVLEGRSERGASPHERSHMEDAGITVLTGTEAEVYFTPQQAFTGVTEEWLRPRLRLDPTVGSYRDKDMSLYVELDGETIEDLDLTSVLGSGPNDGPLIELEDDHGNAFTATVCGGWLETVLIEVRHDVQWIGLEPDLKKIVNDWVIDYVTEWDDWPISFYRVDVFGEGEP
jgi:hypothetical protein